MRIHILGASGSGTTTLGRALSRLLDIAFLDTDDFGWLPSDPPYVIERPIPERKRLLRAQLEQLDSWVLSGSLVDWSDEVEPLFTHIIFVSLAQGIRLARLAAREIDRFGTRVQPGGDMHQQSKDFLAYAARYDGGAMDVRSRAWHEQWLQRHNWLILRLDSVEPVEELVEQALHWLAANPVADDD